MTLRVERLEKRFGGGAALDGVSFDVPGGALVAILGPSGSGKSTLLRVLAGLEAHDGGGASLDGRDLLAVPARARQVGFVFQQYALFRHLTVAENVAFGLRVRGASKATAAERVASLLDRVELRGLGHRYPSELSGGQRQRVALARALAPAPRLLLLDEPFAAVDALVRESLRRWVRALHDELGVTSLLVTHDQEEAFAVADEVLVVREGRVAQRGAPHEIVDAPATAWVAGFLGGTDVVPAVVEGGIAHAGALEVPVGGAAPGPAQLALRAHLIAIRAAAPGIATVERVVMLADRVRVHARVDRGALLTVDRPREEALPGIARGARVLLEVRGARVYPA